MRDATSFAHAVRVATVDRLAEWISDVLAHHMLEAVEDTVVVTNADDRIVLVSRSGASLGWSRTLMIGTRWDEVEHPDCLRERGTASPAPAGSAERRATTVRRGDGGWQDVDVVRYSTHLPDIGPASVVVVSSARHAA
jgi:hypothetical protein